MKQYSLLTTCFLVLLFGLSGCLKAQNETLVLWPDKIPNSITNNDYQEVDVVNEGLLTGASKVSVPTLSVFLVDKENSNGSAVVICPGGGYGHLSMDKEGFKVAKWFNSLGVSAFVLKYRLPSDQIMEDKSIGPLQDAQEALRLVRRNAEQWNINPDKVGIIGFSAGGHLASTVSTQYNDQVYIHDGTSAKPDFSILIYPVISMTREITHKGSRTNLLGEAPSDEMVHHFSNEKQIDSLTPPTFLIHTTDDKVVPVENSIKYYMALKENGVSSEIHIYDKGGHGFGLGVMQTSMYWTESCKQWLKANQFLGD